MWLTLRGRRASLRARRRLDLDQGSVMERAKTFQDMLKEGTFTATDSMLTTGIALVVIGILALLAPLAAGAGGARRGR